MANQRAPGQKAVIVMMDLNFIAAIDESLPGMGFSDRSSFIRAAVREKLGPGRVATSATMAPSRAGKGGRAATMLAREEPVDYRATPKNGAKK